MHIHLPSPPAAQSLPPLELKPVIVRAAIVAALLGPILNLANQWSAIRVGEIDLLPAALFFSTPFLTVFVSQLAAYRAAARKHADKSARLGVIALILRAATIGAVMAMLNISLLASVAAIAGEPPALPVGLALQSLLLPTFFSAVSQYLTHRRLRARWASPGR